MLLLCYLCKDPWHDLLVYLSLNFIPLTVFYLLFLYFSSEVDFCPNDMLHHVQPAGGVGLP